MRLNLFIANAIAICILIIALAFLCVTTQSDRPAMASTNSDQGNGSLPNGNLPFTAMGMVLDGNGNPVVGATITMNDQNKNVIATATSDQNGNFGFPNVTTSSPTFFVSVSYSDVQNTYKTPDQNIKWYSTTGGVVQIDPQYTTLSDYLPASPNNPETSPWCTLIGMVADQDDNGIPNATVTLYETQWNAATGNYDNGDKVNIHENPQMTVSDPKLAGIGTYEFYTVYYGTYNLTAEKTDSSGNVHTGFVLINVSVPRSLTSVPATLTNNVVLPDYLNPA